MKIFQTFELAVMPSLQSLLVKLPSSFFKKLNEGALPRALPKLKYKVSNVRINEVKGSTFHNLTKWMHQSSEVIHPCLLHSIVFPLHLSLLLSPEFQFPVLGVVHIENQIIQHRPIGINETFSVSCKFGELSSHLKGWKFSILVQAFVGHQLVWESSSVYLSNNKLSVKKANTIPVKVNHQGKSYGNFQLISRLGRLYAKCSGDYNPIHLAKWSAKLFGFRGHIAHGMWTKSRCLSALYSQHSDLFEKPFIVNVAFKKPVYLPNNIDMFGELIDEVVSTQIKFVLVSGNQTPHLIGCFQTL